MKFWNSYICTIAKIGGRMVAFLSSSTKYMTPRVIIYSHKTRLLLPYLVLPSKYCLDHIEFKSNEVVSWEIKYFPL